jgi:hypothetical protein
MALDFPVICYARARAVSVGKYCNRYAIAEHIEIVLFNQPCPVWPPVVVRFSKAKLNGFRTPCCVAGERPETGRPSGKTTGRKLARRTRGLKNSVVKQYVNINLSVGTGFACWRSSSGQTVGVAFPGRTLKEQRRTGPRKKREEADQYDITNQYR